MPLTGSQHQSIQAALLDAFDEAELRRLVMFELDENLDRITDGYNLAERVYGLVAWADASGRIDQLIIAALRQSPYNPALSTLAKDATRWQLEPPRQPQTPPYNGLAFYDVADSPFFFGREKLVVELVRYLESHRFLAVVGASDSGKSSVVRAGVLSAIKNGEIINYSSEWEAHVIVPGARPLDALAIALKNDSESEKDIFEFAHALGVDGRSLIYHADRRVSHSSHAQLLLVIDQFEELFTLCRNEYERQAFVDNLVTAVDADRSIRIVITLRADYYSDCAQYGSLRFLLQSNQRYIGALTQEEVRAVIEKPAQLGNWELEPGLTELLLADVGDAQGGLSQLSHALLETWKRRNGRTLTLAGYMASGRVAGAITSTAEHVYGEFTPEQQAIARNIFLRLTALGEGSPDTRRTVDRAELMSAIYAPQTVENVIHWLANVRLVTVGRDTVEVTNEALIREWPRLREWLDQEREWLIYRRRLTEASFEWVAQDRDSGLLYRGSRLALGRDHIAAGKRDLNVREAEFFAASLAADEVEAQALQVGRERELESAKELVALQSRLAAYERGTWLTRTLRRIGLWAPLDESHREREVLNPEQLRAVALQQLVDRAAKEGWSTLDLSDWQLTQAPPGISQLSQVVVLDLSQNQLSEIPDTLFELTNLTELRLRDNKITIIPENISSLKRLVTLDLSSNQLRALTAEIGNCQELQDLYLDNNWLAELPSEIGNLVKLRTLNVSANRIRELPEQITNLSSLTSLIVAENRLTSIPAGIGKLTSLADLNAATNLLSRIPDSMGNLAKLTRLNLSGNRIVTFPATIVHLTNLVSLDLSHNQLEELHLYLNRLSQLSKLKLSSNGLRRLPSSIGLMSKLQELNLDENHLAMLPREMLALQSLKMLDLRYNSLPIPQELLDASNNPGAIFDYYHRITSEEKRPLNEAKVIIVGQGGVGKTSLARRLVNDEFDEQENTTRGIAILPWVAGNAAIQVQEIRLNVWDFGGQEIMHATHQFFLTRRSLYLLVIDARQGEQQGRIHYWLNMIRSFGGDAPVLIVTNKIDEAHLLLNQRGLQQKYPNIQGFYATSCKGNTGIAELRTRIVSIAATLEHIDEELLQSWYDVKEYLAQMAEDYIEYQAFQKICVEHGVADPNIQSTLLRYLHDLGVVLNFQDTALLEETSILNSEWITTAVYSILTNEHLVNQRGIVTRSDLENILDPVRFPHHKHGFILEIMHHFDMCFPLPDAGRFLVAELLPHEEPVIAVVLEPHLDFQYRYNVLPNSVITRFIVRMQRYAREDELWRTGALLHYDDVQAVIRADLYENRIDISVYQGEAQTRREFLAIVRHTFRSIHDAISQLEVDEMVPIPGHENVAVRFQYLLDLKAIGEEVFVPDGLKRKVSVKALLDGVDMSPVSFLSNLQDKIIEHFSVSELRDLCFQLEVTFADLPGDNLRDYARELIEYMRRRGRLLDLIRCCQKMRPQYFVQFAAQDARSSHQ